MQQFIYLRQDNKKSLFPKIREERTEACLIFNMAVCSRFFDSLTERRVKKRGLPVFSEIPLGGISIYRPHKKLFYQELETVLRKAGRRLGTDFCQSDIGIVCDTCEQAAKLIPRLTAPVIWVFCREKGFVFEEDEGSPVFVSREDENIRRLPAVIALTEHPALIHLSPKTVLFNLTAREFVREYTVNDAWMRIPSELKATGISKKVLNSILFDLKQIEKISFLQWG